VKKFLNITRLTLIWLLTIWLLLSIWVEAEGPSYRTSYGSTTVAKKALIVYDADPLYNLDEQVCKAFAKTLEDSGWFVIVVTVPAAKLIKDEFLFYVVCANTYNWAPDKAVQGFLKSKQIPAGSKIAAITLGSGSTAASKRKLDRLILKHKYNLIDSKTFWLLRPNDKSRMLEKNTDVAKDLIQKWAAGLLKNL
jgi:hypothetical protein